MKFLLYYNDASISATVYTANYIVRREPNSLPLKVGVMVKDPRKLESMCNVKSFSTIEEVEKHMTNKGGSLHYHISAAISPECKKATKDQKYMVKHYDALSKYIDKKHLRPYGGSIRLNSFVREDYFLICSINVEEDTDMNAFKKAFKDRIVRHPLFGTKENWEYLPVFGKNGMNPIIINTVF